ncbi:hypothetical protein METP1_00910 [Methanosarcinales archaeon]|nr:hypothetical protein METP1_00910 [Methanosarcinales archaeon]
MLPGRIIHESLTWIYGLNILTTKHNINIT